MHCLDARRGLGILSQYLARLLLCLVLPKAAKCIVPDLYLSSRLDFGTVNNLAGTPVE